MITARTIAWLVGATATAEIPHGAPNQVVRAVTENIGTLEFELGRWFEDG